MLALCTAAASGSIQSTLELCVPELRCSQCFNEPNTMPKNDVAGVAEEHLGRVRRICMSMPRAKEKLSHGEPTFFVKKRVFAMFANNHHNDGRIAVWIPAVPGLQAALIKTLPKTYFKPPYVGSAGWIGIELDQISDPDLAEHIFEAWHLIDSRRGRSRAAKKCR